MEFKPPIDESLIKDFGNIERSYHYIVCTRLWLITLAEGDDYIKGLIRQHMHLGKECRLLKSGRSQLNLNFYRKMHYKEVNNSIFAQNYFK